MICTESGIPFEEMPIGTTVEGSLRMFIIPAKPKYWFGLHRV